MRLAVCNRRAGRETRVLIRTLSAAAAVLGLLLAPAAPQEAAAQEAAPAEEEIVIDRAAFDAWKTTFRLDAVARGISPAVYDAAVGPVEPIERVFELNNRQPEFVRPIWNYLDSALSERRVGDGVAAFAANKELLDRISSVYGVDAPILVAIWGLESAYGEIMGSYDVFAALATLAYDGRRADYGRAQLIGALRILEEGYAEKTMMVGSWAGAMGQTQFIPTTYLTHAIDDDVDGKRNIWTDLGDVFASTANYLSVSGYEAGEPWGVEVRLPEGFDYTLADRDVEKTVGEWAALDLVTARGNPLSDAARSDLPGFLLLPAGARGPAFLVFGNFKAILKYNNSSAYGLAVGLLSQKFVGGGGIVRDWPRDELPLDRAGAIALQETLAEKGFDPGPVDGIIGPGTRKALRAWQVEAGLTPDGFASAAVLEKLVSE